MNRALNFRKKLLVFGIPILIIGVMLFLAKSSIYDHHPESLATGITFDLLVTVPLVYLLLIRKTDIPKTTVVPIFILGMVICSEIIPENNQFYLDLFKTWILPVVELSILSLVIYKVRKALKKYKENKTASIDFYTTLKRTCEEILPKGVVIPVVTEIAVFYYGFIDWKKRKLKANEFTYHKNSGTVTLLIPIIFIVAIETVTLHILLAKWNVTVAWMLTFLSVYSGIQIFGFLKSMSKRPISIENENLFLPYGIMSEAIIQLTNIESIVISSKEITLNNETRKLSILGELESHNVVIRLKEESTWTGLYGIKRKYKNLALHLDRKNEFKSYINNALQPGPKQKNEL